MGWRFYVGEGETGVTNLFACTVSLIMCVTRYRSSTCACAGCVVCCGVVVLCCIVSGCAREASHQGSTLSDLSLSDLSLSVLSLSDLSLATGFGPFNLPTCGPLPKGRDLSHVESCKHIYMSVLFIVVAVGLLLSFLLLLLFCLSLL